MASELDPHRIVVAPSQGPLARLSPVRSPRAPSGRGPGRFSSHARARSLCDQLRGSAPRGVHLARSQRRARSFRFAQQSAGPDRWSGRDCASREHVRRRRGRSPLSRGTLLDGLGAAPAIERARGPHRRSFGRQSRERGVGVDPARSPAKKRGKRRSSL